MGSDLLVLLVLAVAPGADDLPASMASEYPEIISVESSELTPAVSGEPTKGFSSRRRFSKDTRVAQSPPGMRLARAQQTELLGDHAFTTPSADLGESAVTVADGCCSCSTCAAPRGHHRLCCWGLIGLPSPHAAPGDMTQHIPYVAHPQNYYYFRPYNYFHIAEQQREVQNYGGDPRDPYANRIFKQVYARTVDPLAHDVEPELITPIPPSQLR